MYFVKDTGNNIAIGKTLVEAFDNYEMDHQNDVFSDLKFFKATEIKVELSEKQVTVEVPVVKSLAKKPVIKK